MNRRIETPSSSAVLENQLEARQNNSWYWSLSSITFIVLVSVINATVYNQPLYSFAQTRLDVLTLNGALTVTTLFLVVASVTIITLSILGLITQRLLKPICVIGALCNACALYFVSSYQVLLDKTMMGNVFNTDLAEASSFLHPKFLLFLFVGGVLPALILSKIRLKPTSRASVVALLLVTLVGSFIWIYGAARTWLWIDQYGKQLGGLIMPWSYVVNTGRYHASVAQMAKEPMLLPAAAFLDEQKTIVLLVIGESARAQNFSMYGYERLTNPRLVEAGAVALRNTESCATYTTAALRCILSHTDASSEFATFYEPLPSYLQRHGVDVIWRTNNWGEPNLSVGRLERAADIRQRCKSSECEYDEVLLHDLESQIRASKNNKILVVLHQAGSHGPSYNTQYPERFRQFEPECQSVVLTDCTPDQLVNAYDNTVVYTDYLLSQSIKVLNEITDAATLMMYISDHGESLGEYGLYLHGTPTALAPRVQTEIPFIVWMSDGFSRYRGVDPETLIKRQSHSQGNVFHSVMGALGARSASYDASLDVFAVDP